MQTAVREINFRKRINVAMVVENVSQLPLTTLHFYDSQKILLFGDA